MNLASMLFGHLYCRTHAYMMDWRSCARMRSAKTAGERHTEGIEGPQALGEAILLSKSALIQAMVHETVHMELS